MIEVTNKRRCDDVDLLFSDWHDDMTLLALEEGKTDARIFVDNADFAHVAIILRGFRLRLAGNPLDQTCIDAVKNFFQTVMIGNQDPDLTKYLIIYWMEPQWRDILLDILSSQQPKEFDRTYYRINTLDQFTNSPLPEGHRFVDIKEVYETMQDYENYDTVIREMKSEISSPERFLQNCFGICTVQNHTITGWCMSEYMNLSGCEVGIGVAPEYRHQGIATALTGEFIRRAKDKGLQYVGWTSYKHNEIANKTAEKAGLKHTKDYPCIYVDL